MINRAIRREIRRRTAEHDAQIHAAETDPDLDSISTVPRDALIRPVGALLEDQEHHLTRVFHEAFDLGD